MKTLFPLTDYNRQSDRSLLELVRQQNEPAFAALYARYHAPLACTAYKRIPDEKLVEELVQDVFLNLWNKAALIETEESLFGYLFATLRNKVLHQLRSEHTRKAYAIKLQLLNDNAQQASVTSEDIMAAKQLEDRIYLTIQHLSPQCREAFILSRYEQLSYKAIADRMGISTSTVEKHISKALFLLKTELKEYNLTMVVWLLSVYHCAGTVTYALLR